MEDRVVYSVASTHIELLCALLLGVQQTIEKDSVTINSQTVKPISISCATCNIASYDRYTLNFFLRIRLYKKLIS